MLTMRGAALAVFILGWCGICAAQKVHFSPAAKNDVLERARTIPDTNEERAAQLRAWFNQQGCSGNDLKEQKVESNAAPNVICRMPGESEDTVVIGAHFDRVTSKLRPIDNWRSASLLPSLYQCLRTRKRHYTMVFIAFSDSGNDPTGAQTYAAHLDQADLSHLRAMINLDALGLSPTKVWSTHSDKDLVAALMTMVYTMKLPASQISIAAAGKTDSEPFLDRKIPQITIHSITQINLADRTSTPFRPGAFYDSYKLICAYIAYLDDTLKTRPHS